MVVPPFRYHKRARRKPKHTLRSGTKAANKRLRGMPRFYFHLINDLDVPDEEGVELPDLNSAREVARCSARMLMGQVPKDESRINLSHRIEIENDHGRVLETVWFRHVVQVER
jgi:hypothetical protein